MYFQIVLRVLYACITELDGEIIYYKETVVNMQVMGA